MTDGFTKELRETVKRYGGTDDFPFSVFDGIIVLLCDRLDIANTEIARKTKAIESALLIKELWVYASDVKEEHKSEAAALATMLFHLEQALKDNQ